MIFIANVTALTPLSFRLGRDSKESQTLTHIPGTALLASLLNAHQQLGRSEAELKQLFFDDATIVSNLYPASWPKSDKNKEFENRLKLLTNESFPVYPLPTTARSCKRFGGFLFDAKKPNDHHGVRDQLLDWAMFELSQHKEPHLLEQHKECRCGESMDRFEGFYRRGDESDVWGKPKVDPILRMHTGINRVTGAVKDEILYARAAVPEKSEFWGTIQVADEVADDFEEFVEQANELQLFRVGNNRTRGLGKINLRLDELESAETHATLAERIQRFDAQLRQVAGKAAHHALYVPITLTSEAILVDDLLRYTPTLDLGIEGAELVYSNAPTHRVMGWNNLFQVPKADELAIDMGAVFLFGLPTELNNDILQKLLTLQSQGVGLRRREGFGQLLVASLFHIDCSNQLR